MVDAMVHDGLWCCFNDCHMGHIAEQTASKFEASREEQDAFASRAIGRLRLSQKMGAVRSRLWWSSEEAALSPWTATRARAPTLRSISSPG